MKLRNKKTGEIVNAMEVDLYTDAAYLKISKDGRYDSREYGSLAELNAEWEDAPEEQKKYWFIDAYGNIVQNEITKHYGDEYTDMTDTYERQKQIGNWFESKEEAEKAVEKLRALTRLKDKGFRFRGYGRYHWTGEEWPHIAFSYPNFDDLFDDSETVADLDLLFSQEDD